jgi:5'-nucleotidase
MRNLRIVALVVALVVVSGGCTFTEFAARFANGGGGSSAEPYWCAPNGGTALSASDCTSLSIQLDEATVFAYAHDHASAAIAAAATSSAYVPGVGAAFTFTTPTATFNPELPDTLLYDGTSGSAQVAGLEWNVSSTTAPDGFVGPNDVWTNIGGDVWQLRVWILRPFQNEPDIFADTHPCLGSTGPIYDVTDPCYTSTHPNPLQVLVTNDDGYNAPGIDAAVQALSARSDIHVTVSAPATNQSGSGNKTSTGTLTATQSTTLSGYPAYAVNGYPADSVLYALNTLHVNPDLVVSGINDGQNIGPLIPLSGTVGAARQGGKHAIPSVAISQGLGSPPDFPSAATELMSWVNDFLLGRVGQPQFQSVVNINVPTCTSGSIRGVITIAPATALNGRSINPSNCQSTVTTFNDDIDAFVNGYITISSIGNG